MRRLTGAVLSLCLVLLQAQPALAAIKRAPAAPSRQTARPAGDLTIPRLAPAAVLEVPQAEAQPQAQQQASPLAELPLPAGYQGDQTATAMAQAARALSAEKDADGRALDALYLGEKRRPDSEPLPPSEPPRRGWGRVFQDPERNRVFWKWTAGQMALSFGMSAYGSALPKTVEPGPLQASQLGTVQAAGVLARGAASMTTGGYIDRKPPLSAMNRMNMAAAGALLLAPVLLVSGFWTYAALVGVVAAFSAFQTVSQNAGAVAWNRIIGRTESINYANAVGTIALSAASAVGALAGGAVVEWLGPRAVSAAAWLMQSADVVGGALTFGLYGLIVAAVAAAYAYKLRLPGDDGAAPAAASRPIVAELLAGFRLVFSHPTMRLFAVVLAVTAAVGTAVLSTVLPVFIGTLPPVPLAYAWTMAAGAVATGVASLLVAWNDLRHPSSDQAVLERQARRTAMLRAASWVLFASVFLSGSAYAVFVVGFLTALTQVPANIVWAGVQSRMVMRDFPNDQGKVYSAMAFMTLASSFLGLLLIGPVVALLGIPLIAAALVALALAAVADLALARYAFPK